MPISLRRVPTSADLERPGDFAFIQKREPIRTIVERPVPKPRGFFKALAWKLWGKKWERTETLEPRWPDFDTVILLCPQCRQPFAATDKHEIVSLEPLTITPTLTCPYCRTATFQVEEGIITPA